MERWRSLSNNVWFLGLMLVIALAIAARSLWLPAPLMGARASGAPLLSEYDGGDCNVTQAWEYPSHPEILSYEYLYEGPCEKVPPHLRAPAEPPR